MIKIKFVSAINPTTGNIERAALIPGHFGPGKSAIKFSKFNSPYYPADDVPWELRTTARDADVIEERQS